MISLFEVVAFGTFRTDVRPKFESPEKYLINTQPQIYVTELLTTFVIGCTI